MTPSFAAFGDELTKIAFFNQLAQGFKDAVHTGWHGYEDAENPAAKQTWMGMGKLSPELRAKANMGRVGRGIDTATSLGGATKVLPVGAKSLMLLGTGLQAHQALQQNDPTGQGRSRSERVTGLVGSTVGGLAATGALLRTGVGRKYSLASNLIGGIGGGMLAEKAVTAPFRNARKAEQMHQARQQQYAQQQQPQGNPAQVPA